jgi:hypothetical protein
VSGELFPAVSVPAEERSNQVLEEARLPRGGGVAVARQRELVLLGAADAPFLRGFLGVLAHREPRARLGDARRRGLEMSGSQPQPG